MRSSEYTLHTDVKKYDFLRKSFLIRKSINNVKTRATKINFIIVWSVLADSKWENFSTDSKT